MALQDALGKLQDTAASPLEQAFSSPPEIYTNPDMLELELREIFEREWHCPGLAADIAEPGDYVTFSIGDQPVFSIRQKDGAIRSFSNVCRHRMMQLLEGSGNTRTIVCPYHAWTYGQDGSLRGASQMEKSKAFNKKDFCLPEIRTEIWNGWIYITLNQDAAPVAQMLAPMNDLVAQFRMDRYVPCETQDHVWQTNWKLLTENFMEGYHLPVAHKATVGQWIGLDDTVFPDEVSPHFTWQTFTKGETATYGRRPRPMTISKAAGGTPPSCRPCSRPICTCSPRTMSGICHCVPRVSAKCTCALAWRWRRNVLKRFPAKRQP